MKNGWIKIHRKLLENPIMSKPNYSHFWLTLLLMANHKDNKIPWNGKFILIKEGQLLTGRDELSKKSHLPPTTIERILKFLENGHQIEQQKTTKYRIITILNWKEYQEVDIKSDNKRTTNGQQTDTNNNDKNDKNEKEITITESDKILNSQIAEIFNTFKSINPLINFGHKGERKACAEMIKGWGYEKTLKIAAAAVSIQGKPYSPVITNPYQLKIKSSALAVYFQKENNNSPIIV